MTSVRHFTKGLWLVLLILVSRDYSSGQSSYMPINPFTNYHLDRVDITGKTSGFNTSLKPVSRVDLSQLKLAENGITKKTARYLKTELFEYPLYDSSRDHEVIIDYFHRPFRQLKKTLYHPAVALYSQKIEDLTFLINPVFGFAAGKDYSDGRPTYQVSSGGEIRGMIDERVGFYAMVSKNEYRFPLYYSHLIDSTLVAPGEGYHIKKGRGIESFFQATGYVTFSPTKHIGIQFGHDRNFIGNGYRSLILSNYSKEYLFLKVKTKVWRLTYQNLFTQLTDYNKQSATGKGIKPKFFVNHYLGIKLFKNLDIGLFESVIYDRSDSVKNGSFEFNYLNPIIFYRSVENNLNSSDNVMFGGDWKLNIAKRFSFYGQIVLDEYARDSLLKGGGWWGNKYAIQTGLKYINALTINGLDLQVEYNLVRPYTYTHFKKSQNYVNYNQPLAHPTGANFKEVIGILRYQPGYRLFIEAGYIHILQGLDSTKNTKNFGGNVLDTYFSRPYERKHFIGQGVKTSSDIIWLHVSLMLYHNLWLEARANVRTVKSALTKFDSESQWFQLGLRMNMNMRPYDF